MTPRETWTDGRLDEFKENINHRFDQVDKRFDQVDRQFVEVKADIRELRQMMTQGFFVLVGINATTLLALIGSKVF